MNNTIDECFSCEENIVCSLCEENIDDERCLNRLNCSNDEYKYTKEHYFCDEHMQYITDCYECDAIVYDSFCYYCNHSICNECSDKNISNVHEYIQQNTSDENNDLKDELSISYDKLICNICVENKLSGFNL